MNLPNFEHVPYFEHHVKKGSSKSTTIKLVNLVHEDVCRLVDEDEVSWKLKIVCLHGVQNKVHVQN